MRSKICKAKRKDNKEWVEGYYFCMVHDDKRHEHHFIIPIGADLSKGTPIEQIQVEIDIDTLCDDTGLTDKNGRKIWENDIVHVLYIDGMDECNELIEVTYTKRGFSPWNWEYSCDGCDLYCELLSVEVIGNKFDNPELLKEGAE